VHGTRAPFALPVCPCPTEDGPYAFRPSVPPLGAASVLPEPFEPIRRQLRVAHRRGDRAVPEVVLDRPRILAIVGELVSAAMPQRIFEGRMMDPGGAYFAQLILGRLSGLSARARLCTGTVVSRNARHPLPLRWRRRFGLLT
jgi:hypothetical protein